METIQTDVVVIGGGIAGISAAIAVAQESKKVILMDRLPSIGGASVNANVGTICGAFYRSSNQSRIAGNIFSNFFLNELNNTPGTSRTLQLRDGLHVIPYEWTALRNIYANLLQGFKVEVQLNTSVSKVLIKGRRIESVIVGEDKIIHARSVIDCSGQALISQLANLETIKDATYQAASQIFRLRNISEITEYSLNLALKKMVLKNEHDMKWPASHRSLSVVEGSIRNNAVDVKITLPEVISDKTDLKALANIASQLIQDLMPALKIEIKSLAQAEIETIFPLPGFRVMQRSKGKYILSEEDVMGCKKSNHGIAVGTWPIEEWDYDGKLNMQFFAEDDGYHIPADCLMSDQVENLFFGGRNISATSRAMASARVIGTCWQTGYAAGKLSCASNESDIQKTIEQINRGLQ